MTPDTERTDRPPIPGGYSAKQAANLLKVPVGRIRSYVQDGFLEPSRGDRGEYRFTFQDLILLRTAQELTTELSPRKVKRALRGLKDQLPKGRQLSHRAATGGRNQKFPSPLSSGERG